VQPGANPSDVLTMEKVEPGAKAAAPS
jgi:hypothetical protein